MIVGDHHHRGDGDRDADERGEDRHAGRDQRPERQHQDQEGDEEPEELGDLARIRAALVGIAADRRGHRRPGRRRTCLLHLLERVVGGDLVGEGDLGQRGRGPGVQGRGGRGQRVGDRDSVDLADRCHQGRDLGGVRRVGDLARPRLEEHLAVGPGQAEALGEQVLALLRLGARNGERVVVAVAERGRGTSERHQDQHPDADDHPSMPADGAPEAIQADGHVVVPPGCPGEGEAPAGGQPEKVVRAMIAQRPDGRAGRILSRNSAPSTTAVASRESH